VGFTEIDLRWGVTEEESKNGATVEICLKEIDRCRDFPPFFIGFMGERYGWIPRDEDLTAYWNRHSDSPYAAAIKDAVKRGISVTELEMELAVFGNAVTPPAFKSGEVADGRALFLLRDPALSETLYAAARERGGAREIEFIDAGEGKLEILKDRVRNSGLLAVDTTTALRPSGSRSRRIFWLRWIGTFRRAIPVAAGRRGSTLRWWRQPRIARQGGS
jgi:nephrocystin-3